MPADLLQLMWAPCSSRQRAFLAATPRPVGAPGQATLHTFHDASREALRADDEPVATGLSRARQPSVTPVDNPAALGQRPGLQGDVDGTAKPKLRCIKGHVPREREVSLTFGRPRVTALVAGPR